MDGQSDDRDKDGWPVNEVNLYETDNADEINLEANFKDEVMICQLIASFGVELQSAVLSKPNTAVVMFASHPSLMPCRSADQCVTW